MTKVFIYNEETDKYFYVELTKVEHFGFETEVKEEYPPGSMIPTKKPGKTRMDLAGVVGLMKTPSATAFKNLLATALREPV